MAEIILAEHLGNAWLVGGEEYIDDFLINRLPPDVSIRIVTCQSDSEFQTLWNENGGAVPGRRPWSINPQVMDRVRGFQPDMTIAFGPWSALLDDKAKAVIAAAAAEAAKTPATKVILSTADMTEQAAAMVSLTTLRLTLIDAEFNTNGFDESRLVHATRAEDAAVPNGSGLDWIQIALKP